MEISFCYCLFEVETLAVDDSSFFGGSGFRNWQIRAYYAVESFDLRCK